METGITEAVLGVLYRACSQDASVFKPAEEQLRQWETQPGFYNTLTSVFLNHKLDLRVRLLAVLYFKNGIDRYWRRHSTGAISETEKDEMRMKLVASFDEPNPQIAIQLSLLISRIARLDCPRSWPVLIPTLLNAIRVDDVLWQQRAMLTFYTVIKVIASRRLPPDRRFFEETHVIHIVSTESVLMPLTENIFSHVFEMWQLNNANLYNSLRSGDSAASSVILDRCHLCLKVLRKLVVYGFSDMSKSPAANEFMRTVFQRLDQFLKSKSEIESLGYDMPRLREKMIVLLSKVPLDVQETHTEAFVPFIQSSLELTVFFNFTSQGSGFVFERFVIISFNTMRNIIRCENYKPTQCADDAGTSTILTACNVRKNFFTDQVLREIGHQLVLRYFPLTENELKCWQADPESFVSNESGDSCKFSLRPCHQTLFLALVKEFHGVMPHVIMELVQECSQATNPEDMAAILRKDAVYFAVGLASFDLYDLIDFDSWLTSTLVAELRVAHTNYRVIRRRVAYLIGCWVGVKVSPNRRVVIYECLIPLLRRSEDLVIRLEAANSLKSIDDFQFDPQLFSPYLESCFSNLLQLLLDVSECDTKMTVLHVMSFIIERMQAQIRPHVAALVQYLPMLWDSSAEHGMLRCSIISTLTILVQSVGSQCVNMYSLVLPIIQMSTNAKHDSHVYLCEDGLDLWLWTIYCSPLITPQLLELFVNMHAILASGSETMKTSLKVIEAYVLLGSKEFLQNYGGSLARSLTSLLAEIKPEGSVLVFKVIETVMRACPEEGSSLFRSIFVDVVRAVLGSEDYPSLTTMHLSILSRLIINVPEAFSLLLESVAIQHGCLSSELFGNLLDRWFEKLDSISPVEKKKLSALALGSLLTSSSSCVLERFNGIANCLVEVLHDVCRKDSETNVQADCLVIACRTVGPSEDELETEHDRRRYQLSLLDPVHNVSLRDYVISQLGSLRAQVGDSMMSSLMESVDSEISVQLQHFLK